MNSNEFVIGPLLVSKTNDKLESKLLDVVGKLIVTWHYFKEGFLELFLFWVAFFCSN